METRVTEIADGIHQLTTVVPVDLADDFDRCIGAL